LNITCIKNSLLRVVRHRSWSMG